MWIVEDLVERELAEFINRLADIGVESVNLFLKLKDTEEELCVFGVLTGGNRDLKNPLLEPVYGDPQFFVYPVQSGHNTQKYIEGREKIQYGKGGHQSLAGGGEAEGEVNQGGSGSPFSGPVAGDCAPYRKRGEERPGIGHGDHPALRRLDGPVRGHGA